MNKSNKTVMKVKNRTNGKPSFSNYMIVGLILFFVGLSNIAFTQACSSYTSGSFVKNPTVFCDQITCSIDTLYLSCDSIFMRVDTVFNPFDPINPYVYINVYGNDIDALPSFEFGPNGCDNNNGATQISSYAVGDVIEAATVGTVTWQYISTLGDTTLCSYPIISESCSGGIGGM